MSTSCPACPTEVRDLLVPLAATAAVAVAFAIASAVVLAHAVAVFDEADLSDDGSDRP